MPPKHKKEKGNKKKNVPAIPLDEVDTTVLTIEKLQEFCVKVYEALTKESQYSEFLRLERNKLADLVGIATEQLTVLKTDVQAKEVELQHVQEQHRARMSEMRRKITNLSCEKNVECLNNKLETIRKNNHEQLLHEKRVLQIQADIEEMKAQQLDAQRRFAEMKLKCQFQLSEKKCEIREKDTKEHILIENKWEKIRSSEVKNLELKFKEEYNVLYNIKNKQIADFLKYSAKCKTDLNNYYKKIVGHNMSVITTMKTSFLEEKGTSGIIEKHLSQLQRQNKYLEDNLNQSKMKEIELHKKLESSKRDKTELKRTKLGLEENNELIEHMKWGLGALEIRLDKQEDELRADVDEELTYLFKARASHEQNVLVVEHMARHLYQLVVESDSLLAKIKEIYREQGKWHSLLDRTPSKQDTTLDTINYRLTGIVLERDRMVRTYESLLQRHGVHTDNTGFELLEVDDILKDATDLRILVNEEDM